MSIGSKDLHDVEVKIRLNARQAEKLDQAAALFDIPRAVLIRMVWERAAEQGVRSFFMEERNQSSTAA
jgi:hypothetical protein